MNARASTVLSFLLLGACSPASPEQVFKAEALPRLLAGDEAGYAAAVQSLCARSPSFRTNFESALLVRLPESQLKNVPRLHILSPAAIASYPDWNTANGAIYVRWFDEKKPARDLSRITLRLYQSKKETDPQAPRERGEFITENFVTASVLQPDGSMVVEFPTRQMPAMWLSMEIRDADTDFAPDKIEDRTWFNYSYVVGQVREPVVAGREALRELCRRMQATDAQRDLLVARFLASHGYLRPSAQLLELVHQGGQRSAGSDATLKTIYAALGRGPGVPPEPARRDASANLEQRLP